MILRKILATFEAVVRSWIHVDRVATTQDDEYDIKASLDNGKYMEGDRIPKVRNAKSLYEKWKY